MKHLINLAALAVFCATPALADYPERNITLIVPYGAGGGTDTAARLIQPYLEEELGKSLTITNLPGAGGTVGAAKFAASKADGYTLAFLPAGTAVLQPHLRKVEYEKDSFRPICMTIQDPVAIMVGPDAPYDSVEAMIAQAKAGEVDAGGSAPGSFPHVGQMMLGQAYDVKFKYVPHEGGAKAAAAVLGGQVDLLMDNVNLVTKFGLKPLALLASQRTASQPDLPTITEVGGPDIQLSIWYGLFAPANTPEDILSKLSAACGASTGQPDYQENVVAAGSVPDYKSASDFSDFYNAEYERAADLFRSMGLKK